MIFNGMLQLNAYYIVYKDAGCPCKLTEWRDKPKRPKFSYSKVHSNKVR